MPNQPQLNQRVATIVSKAISPSRVFIALMLAVGLWLAPILFHSKIQEVLAVPLRGDGCHRECIQWEPGFNCRDGHSCKDHCVAFEEVCDGGGDPAPLTVSGTINCVIGNNGWCTGNTQLIATASDPQGQTVIISGDVNGQEFACPAGNTTCSVPVTIEGNGTVNYKVNSASGGFASGTTSYQLDYTTPQIDGSINGASGTNGWFISEVIFSVSAVDSVSGLAALETSANGGGWEAYGDPIALSDGVHTIAMRAYDYAGNVAETSQTVKVDTLTPQLDISVSGATGSNSWYVSDIEISAIASDTGSGLFMLETTVDGGMWETYDAPIVLSDGVHTIRFRATDNAGNVTQSEQDVKVDTITPALSLSVNGTKGLNGWYTSAAQVLAVSSDVVSGVASVEAVIDGGAWSIVSSPLSFSDGLHTWQFRAWDNAGNVTESPVQNIKIDTISPIIEMTEELSLGESVYYELMDEGSGLSVFRAVIEDDAEEYKKISWLDSISGTKLQGDILWDGKFPLPGRKDTKDGTKAGVGEYFITLKISDVAGNEKMKSAVVSVNLLSFFQDIPVFAPPDYIVTSNDVTSEKEITEHTFGNTNSGTPAERTSSSTSTGGQNVLHETTTEISFTQGSQSTNSPITNTNILWGAAATAMVGATLAEWKRKQEEKKLAARQAREERLANGPSSFQQAARAYQASLDNFRATLKDAVNKGMSKTEADRLKADVVNSGKIGASLGTTKRYIAQKEQEADTQAAWIEKQEAANAAIAQEVLASQKAAEEAQNLQSGLMAYYAGRKAGEVAVTPVKKENSWWEKAWNWTFKNQTELSLGTGVVLGAAAVVGVVAGVITAPVWLVVGGAILATAALVTAGTAALNAHFGLDLGNKLGINLIAGTVAAGITMGAGFLLANFAPLIGPAIAKTCMDYATACTQVGTIIDKGEEALLAGQIAYYNWRGDRDNAAQTMIELQLELMDGDAPGNTVAEELGEQIANLGPEALEIVEKYGDDAIPYLLKYGDDAVDIIGAYGDEGITLLLKFGDETVDAINLVKQYGTPAVKVLDAVDMTSAKTLLTKLDDGALDYAINQGPDAVRALSYWPDDFLVKYGDELVLRAKDDARTLEAASKLVRLKDLNTKEARDLLDTIANNSIQGGGNRLVLGKWVNDGTLDNGFIGVARADGALFYGTNPGLDKILSKSTDVPQEDLFWAVNNRVLEISVAHDFKIDYSLDGIDPDDIRNEVNAISAIASGKSNNEVAEYFGGKFPFRMREVQVLISHGYKFEVDGAASIIHWVKP